MIGQHGGAGNYSHQLALAWYQSRTNLAVAAGLPHRRERYRLLGELLMAEIDRLRKAGAEPWPLQYETALGADKPLIVVGAKALPLPSDPISPCAAFCSR